MTFAVALQPPPPPRFPGRRLRCSDEFSTLTTFTTIFDIQMLDG